MSSEQVSGFVERITERAAFLHRYIQSPDVEPYRNQPWALVAHIEAYTRKHHVPMLISHAKMSVVRGVLAKMQPPPKLIVEFGAYVGSSAVAWAAILRDLNGPSAEGLRVFAFEMDPTIAQTARDMAELAGVQDVVTVLDGPGSESLKRLVEEGKIHKSEVDMVFIDHWEPCYVPDLRLCEELGLFHQGSVACADNTDSPGAPAYIKYVKGGGSRAPGSVRYDSESCKVESDHDTSIVEVSTVVEV